MSYNKIYSINKWLIVAIVTLTQNGCSHKHDLHSLADKEHLKIKSEQEKIITDNKKSKCKANLQA